jgi:hypothetical protein
MIGVMCQDYPIINRGLTALRRVWSTYNVESSSQVCYTVVITVFNLFLSVSIALFNCYSFALD